MTNFGSLLHRMFDEPMREEVHEFTDLPRRSFAGREDGEERTVRNRNIAQHFDEVTRFQFGARNPTRQKRDADAVHRTLMQDAETVSGEVGGDFNRLDAASGSEMPSGLVHLDQASMIFQVGQAQRLAMRSNITGGCAYREFQRGDFLGEHG